MLKIFESKVVFSEFPDEICLALNISNCPNNCVGCSSPYLQQDVGEELTIDLIDNLIKQNNGITMIGFMGGDNDHKQVEFLANYIHNNYDLKVGMYSGKDYIDLNLIKCLDYYKFGRWIQFVGEKETWKNQLAGPICLPTTNQVMLRKDGDKFENITYKFTKNNISDWENVLL